MKGTKAMNENMINTQNEIGQPEEELTEAPAGAADTEQETVEADDSYSEEVSMPHIADGEEDSAPSEEEDPYSADDIEELKKQFPELSDTRASEELLGSEKYKRFRSLGLTPTEAYMACGGGRVKERLRPSSPLSVKRRDVGISDHQLRMARELFSEMSDTEIQALYRRVTK